MPVALPVAWTYALHIWRLASIKIVIFMCNSIDQAWQKVRGKKKTVIGFAKPLAGLKRLARFWCLEGGVVHDWCKPGSGRFLCID